MSHDRRLLMTAGLALGALLPAAAAAGPRRNETPPPAKGPAGPEPGLVPDKPADQSRELQAAIDRAAERGVPLSLPAGRYLVRDVRLRPGTILAGTPGRTTLALSAPGRLLSGDAAHGVRLDGLVLDGNGHKLADGPPAKVQLSNLMPAGFPGGWSPGA